MTTAGSTFLTSGAKLCCGTAKFCDEAGELSAGGLCAQTSGDTARLAPSPKPRAAVRAFLNQGWRKRSAENYNIRVSCCADAVEPRARKTPAGYTDKVLMVCDLRPG